MFDGISSSDSAIKVLQLHDKEQTKEMKVSSATLNTKQRQDTDSIPGLAQWVKDLALLLLWHGSQLQLRSDPWPGNSMCRGEANK